MRDREATGLRHRMRDRPRHQPPDKPVPALPGQTAGEFPCLQRDEAGMTLTPILTASPLVQAHLATALVALALTPAMALMRKGTPRHKAIGWVWVGAMVVTSLTALAIPSAFNGWRFSPIHALSLVTLFSLTMSIRARRAGNFQSNRGT